MKTAYSEGEAPGAPAALRAERKEESGKSEEWRVESGEEEPIDDADGRRFYFGEWTLAEIAKKRRGGEKKERGFSNPLFLGNGGTFLFAVVLMWRVRKPALRYRPPSRPRASMLRNATHGTAAEQDRCREEEF